MTQPPERSTQVTLATIATHLGVSRSTVSNAYNHPDQLSVTLRERIFESAEALGYNGPDPIARRLRQRRAGAIGVLFSEPLQFAFADPASTLFLEGVATAGESADTGVLLIPARPSEQSAHVVRDALIDGFILYSIPPGHPFVNAALRRRLPVVCVDQTPTDGASWVGIDDRGVAQLGARHLLELGHQNIAVMVYGLAPGETSDMWNSAGAHSSVSRLRLDGYGEAFKKAGLGQAAITVQECSLNTEEAGMQAAYQMLGGKQPPTAIICTSDLLALGALEAARRHNLAVPRQLSVVGFNDLPLAALSDPPLTTVRQPLVEKGFRAARLLLDNRRPDAATKVELEAELVVRASTAPPDRPSSLN